MIRTILPLLVLCSVGNCTTRPPTSQPGKLDVMVDVLLSGPGLVVSSDGQKCSDRCRFLVKDTLTLHAVDSSQWRFAGWAGACTGTGDCSVTVSTTSPATAKFVSAGCDVSGAAGSPVEFQVSPGIRSAALSWRVPTQFELCPTLAYEIRIASNGETRVVSTAQTQIELTGFIDAGGACFWVSTTSDIARSNPVENCTWFPAPPLAPGNVLAFPHSGGVMLEWTPPRPWEIATSPLTTIYPATAYIMAAPDGRKLEADLGTRAAFIASVPPGGPYSFTVARRSAVGDTLYPRPSNLVWTPSSVWRFAGSMPEARGDHAMLAWGGFAYFLGGAEGDARPPARSAIIQTDGSLAFQPLTTDSPAVEAVVAFFKRSTEAASAIAVGGFDARWNLLRTVAVADLAGGTISGWRAGPDMPAARVGHGVGVAQGSIFVIGGQGEQGDSADTFFAPISADGTPSACSPGPCNSWHTGSLLPTPRIWMAVAASDSHLYAIGGYGRFGDLDEVLVADIAQGKFDGSWRSTVPLPHPLNRAAAAIVGNQLYVLGGQHSDRVLIGDLDARTGDVTGWNEYSESALVGKRAAFGFSVLDQRMYVCGGQAEDGAAFAGCQTALIDAQTGRLVSTIAP